MQKPMTKTSVKALCRLVELLKVGHRVKTVDFVYVVTGNFDQTSQCTLKMEKKKKKRWGCL